MMICKIVCKIFNVYHIVHEVEGLSVLSLNSGFVVEVNIARIEGLRCYIHLQ